MAVCPAPTGPIEEYATRQASAECEAAHVPSFVPLVWPAHADAVVSFLSSNVWPYHWQPTLTEEQAANVKLVGDDIESFWVEAGDETIGLIRVFDLDDIATGSPLLDIRIAQAHRGRGVGTAAVSWIVDHLFSSYNELHRIEATTRHDNRAMQRVFERCGFRLEGRLLEAWANADGSRADTWIFAILRREWSAIRPG